MNVLRTIGARFLVKGANKIAGSDTKPFVKNAVIATASHGISMVRGFVSGYLVARLLPRAVFGEYQFLLSIFGSVGFLGLPGLEKAMPRAVARGEGGAIPRIFKWHLCICLIGSIALLGITFFLTPERQHLWSALVIGALILPITQSSATLFGAMSSGLGRFDLSLKANLARSVAIVVAVLIIIFLKPSSLLLFLTVTAFPAISYLWFVRGIMPANDPSIPARPILKYALEMTILTLPAYLATYADKLLISAYFGLNQLAVFSAGILIPEQIKIWAKELLPVSLASQSKGDDTLKRRMSLLRIVGRITLLWLIPVIIGIFLTPLFFALLLPNYPEAIPLTQVGLAFIALQPSALLVQYMEAQAMVRELRWTQWISSIVYFAFLFALLPTMGLMGAVIGRGMQRLSLSACSLWFLRQAPRQR